MCVCVLDIPRNDYSLGNLGAGLSVARIPVAHSIENNLLEVNWLAF